MLHKGVAKPPDSTEVLHEDLKEFRGVRDVRPTKTGRGDKEADRALLNLIQFLVLLLLPLALELLVPTPPAAGVESILGLVEVRRSGWPRKAAADADFLRLRHGSSRRCHWCTA